MFGLNFAHYARKIQHRNMASAICNTKFDFQLVLIRNKIPSWISTDKRILLNKIITHRAHQVLGITLTPHPQEHLLDLFPDLNEALLKFESEILSVFPKLPIQDQLDPIVIRKRRAYTI